MIKQAVFIAMISVLALSLRERAMAISTFEDTISGLPLLKIPSRVPPKRTLFPNGGLSRLKAKTGAPNPVSAPADAGPLPDGPPVAVAIGAFPSVVVLSASTTPVRDYLCAGVLININWVLTAAHCTFNLAQRWPSDSAIYALTGTELLATPGPALAATSIVTHPQYDPKTLRNDLALVQINAKGTNIGPPMRLDGPPVSGQVGEIGSIVGWGVSTNVSGQQPAALQLIQVTVTDSGLCFSATNFASLSATGVFCARSILQYRDVCSQFGGSPLILLDSKGRQYLGGLVSWSAACPADQQKPNVYLDVQFFLPWIKSVIGDKASY